MRRQPSPPARRPAAWPRRPILGFESLEDRSVPATLSLALANAALVENGPLTTATLTRTGDLSQALSVALANSDTTEASVPGSVTIPAGSATATFPVSPVDDAAADGTQPVTLTATAVTGPLTVGYDTTFSGNGVEDTVALNGGGSTHPGAVLVLPDGKVVAAASNNGFNGWAVYLLNPDGSVITTSYVSLPGATEPGTVFALARDANGKILVAGDVRVNGVTDWAVARLNPNASVDFTFGTNGTLVIPNTGYDSIYDIEVAADGGILVAGFWYQTPEFRVSRIAPDGKSVASVGVPVYQPAAGERVFTSVTDTALGADGKLVLVGQVDVQDSSTGAQLAKFSAVARLNADLSPDTSFGPDGVRVLTGASFGGYAEVELAGVAVLADGRVVAGGTAWRAANQSGGEFAAVRFNADGTPDASFAGDGTATLSLAGGGADDAKALALAVQPDGRVVLGGYAWRIGNGENQALARFTAAGAPDPAFNGTGFFVAADYPAQGSFEQINDIVLLPDGRLVAEAGGTTPVTSGGVTTMVSKQWVARFNMATGEALTATATLTVADDDPNITLTVSPATFAETAGAGAATATVTRANVSLAADLVVTLSSGDTTEATVPATVTIPAGQASATFPVAAVDDTVPDGTQAVTLTASAAGLTAAAAVSVTDNEPPGPALQVTIDRAGVLEQTGANAATGTVTRYGFPLDQALTVTLASNDTTEATVPSSVTIPAGQASATFVITSVDDTFVDGTRPVTITASAPTTGLTGPITYDTAWGPNGGWQNGWVNGQVAVAPDGKVVVAGTTGTLGTNADFGVYRYNANGTADSTFGSAGRVQINPVGPSDRPTAVLVQPDGKVVVVGYGATSTTESGEMVVVRLRANGTLDPTFENDGIVRLNFGSGVFTNVLDAALQPDGKILLAGNIGADFAVVRLNPDGTLDATFDGDGVVRTTLSAAAKAYGVAVAPDGKVVAVGAVAEGSAADQRLVVARYTAGGAPDAGFGAGGVVVATVGAAATTYYENATDAAVQPDGKVIVAATLGRTAGGGTDFAVLRFNADGTPDAGFATGGVFTEVAASAYGGSTRVILQPDGRILAAGTAGTFTANTIRGRFVRLSATGVLENRADSAWTTSTTQSLAQDASGNVYLAYNYGSSGSSGYVDRYRTVGAAVTGSANLGVQDNEPFSATSDSYSATEETTLTVTAANGVRSNDVVTAPLSATSVTAELVAGPARGTLTFNADGSFTYTPPANFFGADAFTYRLRDGLGVTNTATVTINVANVNDAPVAANNSYSTPEDTPLTVSAAAAATTSLTMTSDAGDWVGQGKTYSYGTAANFSVTGNATYLTVNYQNPNNTSDYWSLSFRSPFDNVPLTPGTYLNVERAAFRTLGKPGLDVSGQGRGSNTLTGQFTILQIETNANGTISRFAADFEQHSEGNTPALRGSVRFNYVPGAGPGVLSNDSDPDRDPLTVTLVAGPTHGQVTLNPDGTFTYTPDPNYNGPDSFQYKASDGQLTSNTATVSLNVTAVNDPPTTAADAATTDEDAAVTINVVANDSDPEGTALKPTIVTQPAHGTVTVSGTQLVYTPAANFFGTDTFTYKATENVTNGLSGNTATVTVTVNPTPDAPVAQPDAYTTDQGVTLSVNLYNGVLANDSDADGGPLTATVATGPANGALTLNADGSFSYAPDPAYYGTDSFTYTADDGTGRTATATVTLTVVRTNNPPVAQDDAAGTAEDTQVGIAVIGNDSDPDGDAIVAVVFTQPANGSAAYSANDGRIYYTPKKDWSGTDTFTYRAYDGRAYSAPATVTVTVAPVADAPVANSDTFFATEDTPLTVTLVEPNRPLGVLWNDTDAENDPLTVTELVSPPNGGTVALNADGSFTYTPKPNFSGADIFYYRVSDGALSSVGQVTVNVRPVNDPPVGSPDALTATEDTSRNILYSDLTGNDTDPDGDTLTVGAYTQPANGTLTPAASFGGWVYRANPNFFGTDTFTYRPLDRGQVLGDWTTVTITVAAVNDAPVAQSNSYTLTEDTPLTVAAPGVLVNDTDVDGDALSAVLVTGPANGTLTLNADGSFTYVPRANYYGTDSFTYRASDGQLQGANQATVFLTITAASDAPVAAPDSYTVTEDGTRTVAAGGPALDQQSVTITAGGQIFNAGATSTHWQQGVKAGFAGTLKSIDLNVYSGSGSFDLVVSKGAPWQSDTPEYVTRVTVPAGTAAGWITVDVSAGNVALAAGEDFTIGVRNGSGADLFLLGSQDPGSNYPAGRVYYNGGPYPAGTTTTYDLLFRTRMRALGGVLWNDTDADGNALSAVLVAGPSHGTIALAADGGFTYTPDANYNGPDSFTYKANDGSLDSNVATVSITVVAANDPPTLAAPADLTVAEDSGTQTVTLTGIAAGPPDESGTLTVTAASSNTALIPNPTVIYNNPDSTGTLRFTPAANKFGTATITVTVSEGQLTTSRTFTVTVTPVNDAPVAAPDSYRAAEDTPLTVAAAPATALDQQNLAGPTRINAAQNLVEWQQGVTAGAAGTLASFDLYVEGSAATVVSSFDVFVKRGAARQSSPDLFVTRLVATQAVIDQGLVTFDVSAANIRLEAGEQFVIGVRNGFGDGAYLAASDGTAGDAYPGGSLWFNSSPAGGPGGNGYDLKFRTRMTAPAGVLANDTDIDGDTLSAVLVAGPSHGAVALAADGGFTYTPNPDYFGPDSFQYKANDGAADSNVVTVSLTVTQVTEPPVARPDAATTAEDAAVTVAVLANDTDADGDPLSVTGVTPGANGAVTFTAAGATYTPNPNFFGTDTFTYTVSDGHGGSATGTVTVTVDPVNDAPTLDPLGNRTIDEDAGAQTVNLTGISAGPGESQALTVTASSDNPGLIPDPTVTYTSPNATGTLSFAPAANASGTAAITVTVSDGQLTTSRTFTVTVTPVNDAPTLDPLGDRTIDEDAGAQTVGLSGISAGGGESQGLTVTATSSNPSLIPTPAVGYASPSATGTLTFAPVANGNGSAVITVTVSDGTATTSRQFTVTVNAVNDAPVGIADLLSMTEDKQANIIAADLLVNDTDADGDQLSVGDFTQPANGTLTRATNFAGLIYRPNPNFNGTDTFTYRPSDGTIQGDPVTVTVTVDPMNDAPVAGADAATTDEDTAVAVAVLANDTDVEGDALSVTAVTQGANGAVAFTGAGVTYTPAANFFGTDSFTYTVSDGHGGTATGTVTVTVTAVNDPPTLAAPANLTVNEDAGAQTVSLAGITAGPNESQALTVTAASDNPALIPNPTVTYTSPGSAGTLTLTPAANASGTATVTVTVSDGQLTAFRQFTVTVNPVNDPPTLDPLGNLTVAEDGGTQTVGLAGISAGGGESQALTVTATSSNPNLIPHPGVSYASPNATGTLTFFPATNGNGSAVITVTVSDGQTTTSRQFTVTVTAVNDAPLAANDGATTNEDTAVAVAVLANDFDIDRDTLSVTGVTQGAHGAVAFTAAGVTYTPAPNYSGPDAFTYTVSDGNGGSDTATVSVTVTAVNDAPVAATQAVTTAEDTALTGAVSATDVDNTAAQLTYAVVTGPAHGTLTLDAATGAFTYTPAANYSGADGFTFKATDGTADSAAATVGITVTAVNDAPAAADGSAATAEDTAAVVDLTALVSDAETPDAALTYVIVSGPAHGTLAAVAGQPGKFTYTPAANYVGADGFTFKATDGSLESAVRTLGLTVTAVNDAPTTTGLPGVTLPEDAPQTGVTLTGGFADVEDGAAGLSYSVVGNTNPGLFAGVSVAGGVLRLTPAANANGSATLTVRATDAGGLSVQTTLAVAVTAVNDAPSFAPGADQTVAAGSGPQSVGGWATAISRGPAEEAGQGLAFVVTGLTNPGLFVAPPAIDPATGALTFIPEAGVAGTATVTVVLKDTGGTANGGADTSAARTFTVTVAPDGLPTTPGIQMVGSELVITGANTNDTVTVLQQGANAVKVTATLGGRQYKNLSFGGVTRVRVDAGGGNDTVDLDGVSTLPTWTDAGAGDDAVTGGGGDDVIYLGAGEDVADAGAGADFVAGGDDNDLVIGGPGVDQLFGQAGNDILVGGSAAVTARKDSLRKVLSDWNPAAAPGTTGSHADLRNRLAVTDDGVADRLTGGAGTDWFWEPIPVALADQEPGEQRN